ncbi:MAG: hypothetical protein P8L85_20025 [Rubripirellula sp.]|nr:hypothetical protein [Rubripirellula sp.]
MNEILDEHELQRLLDGNLSSEERILLLHYVEAHPTNWRRIAMAFVEEQVLRNEFAKLQAIESPATKSPTAENRRVVLADPISEPKRGRNRIGWLTQAAVICLALGGAVWMGRVSVEQLDPVKPKPAAQVAGALQSQEPSQEPSQEAIVSGSESSTQPIETTGVVAATNPTEQTRVAQMFKPLFDQETLAVFREYGYTVAEEPVIYVVPGQAGEQYFVPRRNVSLVAQRE